MFGRQHESSDCISNKNHVPGYVRVVHKYGIAAKGLRDNAWNDRTLRLAGAVGVEGTDYSDRHPLPSIHQSEKVGRHFRASIRRLRIESDVFPKGEVAATSVNLAGASEDQLTNSGVATSLQHV